MNAEKALERAEKSAEKIEREIEGLTEETEILKTVFFNGSSARVLTRLAYRNGVVEYSITQVNLYTGLSEYHRFFDKQIDAENAF